MMELFISNAYAQSAGAGGASAILNPLFMLLIFVVFYFLLIRPQQKRQKEHRAMVSNLGKGDEVETRGGLLGKVTKVGENYISVELAEGMTVKMAAAAVAKVLPKGTLKSA